MTNLNQYCAWFIRITAGLMLVLIGTQPIQPMHLIHDAGIYPVTLQTTDVPMLDVSLRILFVAFGLAIMVGIRTRLLAAFMLAVTTFQTILCFPHDPTMTLGHAFLGFLLMALAILVSRGGGIHSLIQGGWKNIPL